METRRKKKGTKMAEVGVKEAEETKRRARNRAGRR